MNVTMHPSKEFSDMSNLSTTSVVGALNLVGKDIEIVFTICRNVLRKVSMR